MRNRAEELYEHNGTAATRRGAVVFGNKKSKERTAQNSHRRRIDAIIGA